MDVDGTVLIRMGMDHVKGVIRKQSSSNRRSRKELGHYYLWWKLKQAFKWEQENPELPI